MPDAPGSKSFRRKARKPASLSTHALQSIYMRFAALTALCLCLLPAISAQEKSKPGASAFDKTQMEAYVRHLLAVIPDVQVKIDDPKPSPASDLLQVDVHFSYQGRTQDETFYVTKNGQNVLRGVVYNFAQNPFQDDLDKLKTTGAPSFGPASAPVTVVEFGDFECPNCKEEAKTLRDNVPTKFPTEVHVVFKDFPLEQIHPWAKAASIAGRCVYHQSEAAFWKYHDWIYEHQSDIQPDTLKPKIMEFAKTTPELDSPKLGSCIDTKATEGEVDASIAEARALHVDATPTVFLNGRRLVGNYPWSNLDQIINVELSYQKSAHKTSAAAVDEKCCEIKIPSPLNK
jgi:protein-disulfide isomerase